MGGFWLTHKDWRGKEYTGFYIGIQRFDDVLRLTLPNGKWTDTGHNYTEEQAIKIYNDISANMQTYNAIFD
jgi:hypothetical protein